MHVQMGLTLTSFSIFSGYFARQYTVNARDDAVVS